MRKILVFGAGGIAPIQYEEGTMLFETSKSSEHFAQYDIVVYFSGAFEHRYRRNLLGQNLEPIPPTAIRRENEKRLTILSAMCLKMLSLVFLNVLEKGFSSFFLASGGQMTLNIWSNI